MLNLLWNYTRSQKGQGMVEYGMILALISIAALAAITPLGPKILAAFTSVNNALP